MDANLYRAYDGSAAWMGPPRQSQEAAEKDAAEHDAGCANRGGYGSAIVVRSDPAAPGRCVDLTGASVWPPQGRGNGALRWR